MSLMVPFARRLFNKTDRDLQRLGPCHHCYEPTTDRFRAATLDAPLCAKCASICDATCCDDAETPRERGELLAAFYAVIDAIDGASEALNATGDWPYEHGTFQSTVARSEARRVLDELATDVFCETHELTRTLQTLHRCCPIWRVLLCAYTAKYGPHSEQ